MSKRCGLLTPFTLLAALITGETVNVLSICNLTWWSVFDKHKNMMYLKLLSSLQICSLSHTNESQLFQCSISCRYKKKNQITTCLINYPLLYYFWSCLSYFGMSHIFTFLPNYSIYLVSVGE